MARIAEYTAAKEKLTPSREGYQAWEQAGRRIGPAYNEAANLMDRGQTLETQATDLAANQQDKLQRALLSQYKDLYDAINAVSRAGTGSRGGGAVTRERGGGSVPGNPAAVSEISNGAAQLADTLKKSKGGALYDGFSGNNISGQSQVKDAAGNYSGLNQPDQSHDASVGYNTQDPAGLSGGLSSWDQKYLAGLETGTSGGGGPGKDYTQATEFGAGTWSSADGAPPQPDAPPSSGLLNFSWLNSLTSGGDPATGPLSAGVDVAP